MRRTHIFEVDGMIRFAGGLLCDRLIPTGLDISALTSNHLERTHRWAEENNGSNELHLQRALAHPRNHDVLRSFVGNREDGKVKHVIREVGGQGGIDLVAWIDHQGRKAMLLVDCKGSKPPAPADLQEHAAKAVRNAMEALTNIWSVENAAEQRLLLLSGWAPNRETPQLSGHPGPDDSVRPSWTDSDFRTEHVPALTWWGYVPFYSEGREYVIIGPWDELDGLAEFLPTRPVRQTELASSQWFWTAVGEAVCTPGATMCMSIKMIAGEHQHSLRLPWHGRAGSETAREIKRLRDLAHSGQSAAPGWKFVGETNSKGNTWLHWIYEGDEHEEAPKALLDALDL